MRILGGVSGRLVETACGKLDDSPDLIPVQPVKPFHDVVDAGPSFQILENRGHRHARALQNPRATDFSRNALDRGAFRSIEACHIGFGEKGTNWDYSLIQTTFDLRLTRAASNTNGSANPPLLKALFPGAQNRQPDLMSAKLSLTESADYPVRLAGFLTDLDSSG
jgi:hypothetical protein